MERRHSPARNKADACLIWIVRNRNARFLQARSGFKRCQESSRSEFLQSSCHSFPVGVRRQRLVGPLKGLRVAVTIPPTHWFGGIDYNFAIEMSDEMRTLGADVFEVDVHAFSLGNKFCIDETIAALRSFRPDVAVALPNSGYVLNCVTPTGENIFTDVLQVPTVMLWDHGLLQFPKQLLHPLPRDPQEGLPGSVEKLRRVLNHPLYFHYSPDRGHIEQMGRLGLIDPNKVQLFLQPAYPNFVRYGYTTERGAAFASRVAFAGNVYLQQSKDVHFRRDGTLADIEKRVLEAKKARLN